jgi:hypothetical protein
MSDSPYDGPMGEQPDYLPPMANCAECKQGYARHVLDANGVCPRCKLERIEIRPNPYLPENCAQRYTLDSVMTLRPGIYGG